MACHLRRRLATRAVVLVVIPAASSACQAVDIVDASWFRAQIRGAVEGAYEGTGDFHVGSDPRVGISVKFTLNSDGVGAHAGQRFMLYRPGEGRPGKGVYSFAPLAVEDGSPRGFTAYYFRTADGEFQAYTATSGEVRITESSERRLAGDFRFTGALYCRAATTGNPEQWCTDPNTITPGAPELEVTASFLAVPFRPGPIVEESRVGRP